MPLVSAARPGCRSLFRAPEAPRSLLASLGQRWFSRPQSGALPALWVRRRALAPCQSTAAAQGARSTVSPLEVVKLRPQQATAESFREFGQVSKATGPELCLIKNINCCLIAGPGARLLHTHLLNQAVFLCLQLLSPVSDGKQFDQEDAQLQLDKGIPR